MLVPITIPKETKILEQVLKAGKMKCQPLFIGLCFLQHFSLSPGNEKHDLQVTPQEGNSEPIVQDLAQVVEEATGVPLPFQKLIFKGKPFSSPSEPI